MNARIDLSATTLSRYRTDIDGLRAVAVLLVLVFHFALLPGAKAGFLGVDIFFVISGFLITSIIKGQLDADAFSLRTFYVRRIRRLAPALFSTLTVSVAIGGFCLLPMEWMELAKQALFAQLYSSNLYYWHSIDYFGLSTNNAYLLHTWSLAVEEQFYLFFPVFLMLVHRYARTFFWKAIAASLAVSFTLNMAFVVSKPEATFYLLPTRAWELLVGSLVSWAATRLPSRKILDEMLGFLGAALILVAVLSYSPDTPFPGAFALLPTLGAACLLIAGRQHLTFAAQTLSWAPLVYVGRISYSLYLVHWPINVFAGLILPDFDTCPYGSAPPSWVGCASLLARTSMFALSFVLAAALYHIVENPIRRRSLIPSNGRLLVGYGVGVAATIVFFFALRVADGFPQRFPEEAVRLAAYANDKTKPLESCEFKSGTLQAGAECTIGATGLEPRWLVYGDSHAWAAHAAFDRWLRSKGEAGVLVFRHGCPPVKGIYLIGHKGACNEFNEAVFHFLDERNALDNVVLVSTWRQAREGLVSTSPTLRLSPDSSIRLFSTAFVRTIERLHEKGRAVHVWEPVPGARRSVPQALARGGLHAAIRLEPSLEEYRSYFDYFFEALNDSRKLIVSTFSPAAALCASGSCSVTHAGAPLYFDDGHVTSSSADFWVSAVLQKRRAVQAPAE